MSRLCTHKQWSLSEDKSYSKIMLYKTISDYSKSTVSENGDSPEG